MDTTIRYANMQDLKQIINLWDVCFEDPISWRDWYFSNRFVPENTLVLELNSRIVSAMQIRYYPYNISQSTVVAPNLLGVCTLPEFRGCGFMGQLLNKLTLDLYASGVPFLVNTPTNAAIYSKHSHAQILRKKICSATGGKSEMTNFGDLHYIYSVFSSKYSFMVQRDTGFMQSRIDDIKSDGGIICSNDGAYAMYHLTDDVCNVDELCFTEIEHVQKLFECIPAKTINFELPSDICCPEYALFKEFAPVLARIVHLENFIKLLPNPLSTDIVIKDRLIAQNNTSVSCMSSQTNREIELDIGELAMYVFASLSSFNADPY